jgi:para-nitrobenzyl esterase
MTLFTPISRAAILLGCSLLSFTAQAQYDCTNSRFLEEVFPTVTLTSNIEYGAAININGALETLTLDVYEPTGDDFTERPLIVFAHGGSFLFGNKTSADIVTLCNKYTKLGYVCASINYRLGFEGLFPNPTTATETVYRATADMRAAIRYFRKDRSTSNQFRIDTTNIYGAGVSAGAFIALHLAYLDQPEEIPAAVDAVAFGGIEGLSGNEGYSSKVKAIVNLCGAIGDSSWINPGDAPCISMHGTADDVVPYGSAVINVVGINLFVVDGSRSVAARQEHMGIRNEFVTWNGAAHVPFGSSAAYMDSVFMAVTPFLAEQLGCEVPNAIATVAQAPGITLWPNPSEAVVNLSSSEEIEQLQLIDIQGKVLLNTFPQMQSTTVSVTDLPVGMYLLRIFSGSTWQSKRLIKG